MKTICVFIFIGLICVISGCFIWMVQNSSAQTVMLILYILVSLIFIIIYDSCEESNQQTAKKITPVQSNTEPVTYSTYTTYTTYTTYSHQNNTSAQSDITPTKQYPVLGEIQKIISNLTELEKDNDLDKNMFAKFHKLKEQFDLDYQKTIKILNKLDKFKPIDEKHLKVFNHYLDLFKEEKDYIYKQIEQNYDNEIDAIYNNLDNIND